MAESLNRSPKTLQRQLAAEGVSFSELLESVRQSMAKHLLRDTNAPVANIAGLLDYGSTPPFSSAFRRWTGQAPLAFRKLSEKNS